MAGIFQDGAKPVRPKTLLDTDTVIVQNRRHVRDAHGGYYEPYGDPILVVCNVENHAQQAGMFSISGNEDKNPTPVGGLQEVFPIRILAREWPGDIYSLIWFDGEPYDADGSPTLFPHSTDLAAHYEIRARRIANKRFDHKHRLHPPEPPEGARVWGA